MSRWQIAGAFICAFAISAPALGQDANYANRVAYKYALRCFVAGGIARNKPSENPRKSRTAALTNMAEKAYNSAFLMGKSLGYAEREIGSDLDRAQEIEARALVQNPTYFAQTKAACVKLDLMLP